MISAPLGVRVYLACGTTDMRKGMDGLAMVVQQVLADDQHGRRVAYHGPARDVVGRLRVAGAGI